ncbi:MAG: glycosyltransferase family 4 protein [Polyangiaceae bacterium]
MERARSAIVLGPIGRLSSRTARAVRASSFEARITTSAADAASALAEGARHLATAGAFGFACVDVPPSATGRPVLAVGLDRSAEPANRLLAETGGDLSAIARSTSLPWAQLAVDERAASLLARALEREGALEPAVRRLAEDERPRVVHVARLDGWTSKHLRVAEIVTSLQIGGAERVARALAAGLACSRLFALGRPTRTRMPPLENELDLGAALPKASPGARIDALLTELRAWGADVAHVHLFGPDVVGAVAREVPTMVTIHNARQAWPEGTLELADLGVTLVCACASAVERELRDAGLGDKVALRTVHNGVPQTSSTQNATLRARWGLADGELAVLVVANPRPQKRLDRVPAAVHALARRTGRPTRVVWAGAPSAHSEEAAAIARALASELARLEVPLLALGAIDELGPIYGACDVLLSTSAWEGLSLAHLEALAAGLPVVATRVGGTEEIVAPAMTILEEDATADDFAGAMARATEAGAPRAELPGRFTEAAMVRSYARLAARVRSADSVPDSFEPKPSSERGGLVLVTNNLSPGGAQSSARRLVLELARRGWDVRVVLLEEHDASDTPGTAALRAAAIPVLALDIHGSGGGAERAALRVLDELDRAPTRAVLFWNALAEVKLLVAELSLEVPVVDVSPGEMLYTSLERTLGGATERAREYGARLAAFVVKHARELDDARRVLGCAARVIPNGVPIRARSSARAPTASVVFGTAVRIHPHKRLDLLLDAFREVVAELGPAGAELRVAGMPDRGQEAYALELEASARDLPVRWLGFRDELAPFLDELEVFVLVSEPAGCPNASLEAMAAGLPIVATDHGGAREQLEGVGLVTPRTDAKALARAMLELARDPAKRASASERALERARARFSLERMADDYESLLRTVRTR